MTSSFQKTYKQNFQILYFSTFFFHFLLTFSYTQKTLLKQFESITSKAIQRFFVRDSLNDILRIKKKFLQINLIQTYSKLAAEFIQNCFHHIECNKHPLLYKVYYKFRCHFSNEIVKPYQLYLIKYIGDNFELITQIYSRDDQPTALRIRTAYSGIFYSPL